MKKELLSPVGSMEALYQAIHNGADAVYLGGKKFGARMFANNFDKEELKNAIDYCHLYGVKIYITINTVIFDSEIDEFLDYVEYIYKSGVDAVIMQDVGMISLVRAKFPDLEIHASTQVHNYNEEGIKLLKNLGVTRVVLARELSLDEINHIHVDIEKEIFIHGAICVCFSGCCLFSSMNTNRSGNRGECVASCRLPYKLYRNNEEIKTNGQYLLSTKELNTSTELKKILDSDITSLKIEGRMKSPEYVGFITRLYRKLIDNYYDNKSLDVSEKDLDELKTLFNREFTRGYLFNAYGKELMNIKSPNHIGLTIGKVISTSDKYIKIKLSHDLYQEDAIKFLGVDKGMIINKLYNDKMLLVNSVKKGDIAIIDNKVGLNKLVDVAITISNNLLKELQNYEEKRIDVSFDVEALINNPLRISVSDGKNNIVVYGNIVQESINKPVTKENIYKQLSKLGNTPFKVQNIVINMDDHIFVSLKELNELRRDAIHKLISERIKVPSKVIHSLSYNKDKKLKKDIKLGVLVRNEEQLLVSLSNNLDYIYVTDFSLYNKYKDYSNIYFRTDRVISKCPNFSNMNLLVTELGGINKYTKDNYVCSDYYLNVTNNASINLLEKLGVKRVTLSPEVKDLSSITTNIDAEIVIYGRIELMITKYCPLNMLINKDNKKCNLCLNGDKYYLKDQNNHCYPLLNDKHITHIMDHKNINLVNNIKELKKKGINCFRIELFDEDSTEVNTLIKNVQGVLYE